MRYENRYCFSPSKIWDFIYCSYILLFFSLVCKMVGMVISIDFCRSYATFKSLPLGTKPNFRNWLKTTRASSKSPFRTNPATTAFQEIKPGFFMPSNNLYELIILPHLAYISNIAVPTIISDSNPVLTTSP